MRFGAVITAAGLSSRMGAFKPLLPLGNTTFIERIISTMRKGGAGEIAIVTGRDAPLIIQALAGYTHINFIYNNDFAVTDMFYSVSLGLKFMAEQVEGIFFTPVDVPLFSAGTVSALASAMQSSDAHILVPSYQGCNGHPVVIRSCAAKELIRSGSPNGLKGAINTYAGPKSTLKTDDSGIVYDADTLKDYQFIKTFV